MSETYDLRIPVVNVLITRWNVALNLKQMFGDDWRSRATIANEIADTFAYGRRRGRVVAVLVKFEHLVDAVTFKLRFG